MPLTAQEVYRSLEATGDILWTGAPVNKKTESFAYIAPIISSAVDELLQKSLESYDAFNKLEDIPWEIYSRLTSGTEKDRSDSLIGRALAEQPAERIIRCDQLLRDRGVTYENPTLEITFAGLVTARHFMVAALNAFDIFKSRGESYPEHYPEVDIYATARSNYGLLAVPARNNISDLGYYIDALEGISMGRTPAALREGHRKGIAKVEFYSGSMPQQETPDSQGSTEQCPAIYSLEPRQITPIRELWNLVVDLVETNKLLGEGPVRVVPKDL